eukprot:05200_4
MMTTNDEQRQKIKFAMVCMWSQEKRQMFQSCKNLSYETYLIESVLIYPILSHPCLPKLTANLTTITTARELSLFIRPWTLSNESELNHSQYQSLHPQRRHWVSFPFPHTITLATSFTWKSTHCAYLSSRSCFSLSKAGRTSSIS